MSKLRPTGADLSRRDLRTGIEGISLRTRSRTSRRSAVTRSVVASLTIDFHHEITAGQLVLVTGAFTRVGQKSFGYEMRLYEADSMIHCATQKTTEVCFDTTRRASVPLPDDVRGAIAGHVV